MKSRENPSASGNTKLSTSVSSPVTSGLSPIDDVFIA
jgi:hypothetical protein